MDRGLEKITEMCPKCGSDDWEHYNDDNKKRRYNF